MAKMKKTRLLLTIIGIAPLIMAATHRPENMIIYGYDKVTAKVSEVNIDDSGLNRIEVYNYGDGYVTLAHVMARSMIYSSLIKC